MLQEEYGFAYGIVISASYNGVHLSSHLASFWGVEANFPQGDNSYLSEVANELLDEARDEVAVRLETLRGKLAA